MSKTALKKAINKKLKMNRNEWVKRKVAEIIMYISLAMSVIAIIIALILSHS